MCMCVCVFCMTHLRYTTTSTGVYTCMNQSTNQIQEIQLLVVLIVRATALFLQHFLAILITCSFQYSSLPEYDDTHFTSWGLLVTHKLNKRNDLVPNLHQIVINYL